AGAGVVALVWGMLAAWGVAEFVLDADFVPAPGQALAIILVGAVLNLIAGLVFAARPLRLRPAGVLRVQAG
ncbi:MAG: hypothetical protein AAF899_03790, partial [Pseudomonadota bacterium]